MKNLKDFINESSENWEGLFNYLFSDIDLDELNERTNNGKDVDELINWAYNQFKDDLDELEPEQVKLIKKLENPTSQIKSKVSKFIKNMNN